MHAATYRTRRAARVNDETACRMDTQKRGSPPDGAWLEIQATRYGDCVPQGWHSFLTGHHRGTEAAMQKAKSVNLEDYFSPAMISSADFCSASLMSDFPEKGCDADAPVKENDRSV